MFPNREPEVSTNRSSFFNQTTEIAPSINTTPEEQEALPPEQSGWTLVNGGWFPPANYQAGHAGDWITYTL